MRAMPRMRFHRAVQLRHDMRAMLLRGTAGASAPR